MNDRQDRAEALHQIIFNDDHQYVVWPSARRLPSGWRYVGREGTKLELEFYLLQMAVETVPAPLLVTRPADTVW